MGFIDNVKSRFKNNDEEEFGRALREGAFPEGVEDFEPMTNTGSFLPATFDVDPLADASLPGNARRGALAPEDEPMPFETESVVRSAGTAVYAVPSAASPFQVIDGSLRARGASAHAADPSLTTRADPVPPDFPGFAEDAPDEEVQVFARSADGRPSGPRVGQKPFADRLRERVASASAAEPVSEAGELLPGMAQPPVRARRSDDATDAELDAELAERRRARLSAATARAEAAAASAERFERERSERYAVREAEVPRMVETHEAAPGYMAVPLSCSVVRPRFYDDVRDVAQGVIVEHRPTVLVLRGCTNDLARRILDFSFGLCCGTGATIREFGGHTYAVLPRGTMLTEEDMAALRRQSLVR